jgi:hypothetical protein
LNAEFFDTDCLFSAPVWKFVHARKAPTDFVTLEIDKIFIRYFGSLTVTAQKSLCKHFGTYIASPHIFRFRGRAQVKRIALPPLPHRTRAILHDPTIGRPKTGTNHVDAISLLPNISVKKN